MVDALTASIIGRTVYIYNLSNQFLLESIIKTYDDKSQEVEIAQNIPLKLGDYCRIVIKIVPVSYEYVGRVIGSGPFFSIVSLHRKYEMDNCRKYERYKINCKSNIESLIYNECSYKLQKPLPIELVDISRSGVRLRTADRMMTIGIKIEICLKIGKKEERIIAEVTNISRIDLDTSEYGCSFYAKGEDIGRRVEP